MPSQKYDVLPFLPKTRLRECLPGITLLHPLTRRGTGPGLIVLVSESGVNGPSSLEIRDGVPCPFMKWGEEGYTVVEITEAALKAQVNALDVALNEIRKCSATDPNGHVGLVAYHPELWNQVANKLDSFPEITGAVIYDDLENRRAVGKASLPQLHHLAGKAPSLLPRGDKLTEYDYPTAKSFRNLGFLEPLTKGPYFDLGAIWEEHTYYEFEQRSVEHTMATMVQEPYVNHVTTTAVLLTGGIGREALTAFYRDHFIFQNPDDVETEVLSRSIGIDRVIDEFVFKCTHDRQVDWMIPGIPATGEKLEVPVVTIVNIRGDRLYHEHISWDQGTIQCQLGLMPEHLPLPYPVQGGAFAAGKPVEYRVPAAGIEATQKLRDKDGFVSNHMFAFKLRQA